MSMEALGPQEYPRSPSRSRQNDPVAPPYELRGAVAEAVIAERGEPGQELPELRLMLARYVAELRMNGTPPQSVVIAVKALFGEHRGHWSLPNATPTLVERVVRWAIEDYFGDD